MKVAEVQENVSPVRLRDWDDFSAWRKRNTPHPSYSQFLANREYLRCLVWYKKPLVRDTGFEPVTPSV